MAAASKHRITSTWPAFMAIATIPPVVKTETSCSVPLPYQTTVAIITASLILPLSHALQDPAGHGPRPPRRSGF
jgi:hypothetical protein